MHSLVLLTVMAVHGQTAANAMVFDRCIETQDSVSFSVRAADSVGKGGESVAFIRGGAMENTISLKGAKGKAAIYWSRVVEVTFKALDANVGELTISYEDGKKVIHRYSIAPVSMECWDKIKKFVGNDLSLKQTF